MTRISIPSGSSGEWRTTVWQNDEIDRTLERATLEVDPPNAFRSLCVRRTNGDLLANEAWDQSRTRALRVLPEDTTVKAGESLHVFALAWFPVPVRLTAILIWEGTE